MLSGELAELAGVTKRTLYHWHKLGILPEPERQANGYREYSVLHLLRVLRIRRLVSLGLALEEAGRVLDEGPESHASVLEEGLLEEDETGNRVEHLFREYDQKALNPAQREVLALIERATRDVFK